MYTFVSADVRGGGRLRDEPKEGLRRRLWEHEPQASVSTAFSSSPKLSRMFV